jgi:hypothetical protein
MDLLRNVYKIENVILETNSKDKKKTFEIKENLTLQIETNKINDEINFIGKMDGAMKIYNSKYGYYLKFGIQGSKKPDILSISFVVYYSYKNSLYPYFSVNNPIKDIKSSKIPSLSNTFKGGKSLEKKNQSRKFLKKHEDKYEKQINN